VYLQGERNAHALGGLPPAGRPPKHLVLLRSFGYTRSSPIPDTTLDEATMFRSTFGAPGAGCSDRRIALRARRLRMPRRQGRKMENYDLIVIGAGPAGLTAGLYAGRARLSTLMLEMMMPGGYAATTERIENYPGIATINGMDLATKMLEHAQTFGAKLVPAGVTGLEVGEDGPVVVAGPARYGAKAVIVATGTGYRKLGVPGETELAGRGVSYCATCDGPFFKNEEIAVVGGGDSALQEALYLTTFAKKIYLIHRRDEFRAIPILEERVRGHEKIECLCSHVVDRINGEGGVESLDLHAVKSGETRTLPVKGVFLFVGLEPKTKFVGDLIDMDDRGFLITDADMKTKTRGILAAGDCRMKTLRQIATAVGDGATAAFVAQKYIEDGEW
jgi:thioredoxin reductase (NADPH)